MRKLALITMALALIVGFTAPVYAEQCNYTLTTWALLEPDEARIRGILEDAYVPFIQDLESQRCDDPEGYEGFCQSIIDNAYARMEEDIAAALESWTLFYNSDVAEGLRNSRCAKTLLWFWSVMGK